MDRRAFLRGCATVTLLEPRWSKVALSLGNTPQTLGEGLDETSGGQAFQPCLIRGNTIVAQPGGNARPAKAYPCDAGRDRYGWPRCRGKIHSLTWAWNGRNFAL